MGLALKGGADATRNMKLALDAIAKGAKSGNKNAADAVLRDSNTNAPNDTGALIASGEVKSGTGSAVKIEYGVPYAGIVHERHDQPDRKFLQKALQKNRQTAGKEIAQSVRKELRRVKPKMKGGMD